MHARIAGRAVLNFAGGGQLYRTRHVVAAHLWLHPLVNRACLRKMKLLLVLLGIAVNNATSIADSSRSSGKINIFRLSLYSGRI